MIITLSSWTRDFKPASCKAPSWKGKVEPLNTTYSPPLNKNLVLQFIWPIEKYKSRFLETTCQTPSSHWFIQGGNYTGQQTAAHIGTLQLPFNENADAALVSGFNRGKLQTTWNMECVLVGSHLHSLTVDSARNAVSPIPWSRLMWRQLNLHGIVETGNNDLNSLEMDNRRIKQNSSSHQKRMHLKGR